MALTCSSPNTISGTKYTWVPMNDMDRTLMGSTTNSGPLCILCLFFHLRFRWKHDAAGTMQLGKMHEDEVTWESLNVNLWSGMIWAVDMDSSVFKERSKSVSITWPSDRTNTFSGLRSRYAISNMWRYSSATNFWCVKPEIVNTTRWRLTLTLIIDYQVYKIIK